MAIQRIKKMRYKVIFYRPIGSTSAGMANSEFYVLAEAVACAEAWPNIASDFYAYVWDGENWTQYGS